MGSACGIGLGTKGWNDGLTPPGTPPIPGDPAVGAGWAVKIVALAFHGDGDPPWGILADVGATIVGIGLTGSCWYTPVGLIGGINGCGATATGVAADGNGAVRGSIVDTSP